MIQDGNGKDGETFEADVCVVGAGAAGLTLALDLARRGIQVVLVESGGLKFDKQTNQLLDTEFLNTEFIHMRNQGLGGGIRARYFGGTTNLWGGVCLPLDPFEFEYHSWVPNSGWPFSRTDLDPYYTAAAQLLGLSSVNIEPRPASLGAADRKALVADSETDVIPTYPRRLPNEHRRMGEWRYNEVASSPLIQCVLNTTVVELHTDTSGQKIVSLEGRTFGNDTLTFRAKQFVLCTSAIENARLLLASDKTTPGGLGNAHDLVGRYFMIHPPNGDGRLMPFDSGARRTQEEFLSDKEAVGWTISPEGRQKYQLQGFHAFMISQDSEELLPHEIAVRSLTHSLSGSREDLALVRRRRILVNWEQSPNPLSRVVLSDKRDELGVLKPRVNFDITPLDLSRAQKSWELISLAVARSGLARIQINDITKTPIMGGAAHQIGTTRMSHDPRHGVTDANGRVHSLENLFIGGSSLFPTGGWQNPTFTIVALALRLADFLDSRSQMP